MRRWLLLITFAAVVGVMGFLAVIWWQVRDAQTEPARPREAGKSADAYDPSLRVRGPVVKPTESQPKVDATASAADRAASADKIRRDYDEITKKISAEYAAAGDTFPGGLNAYLRQLALLQREKHADLAALLTPRELEDLEMRDTNAGQSVQRLLGESAATEEQRRAVFRLEQEFEDKFALTFDLTPAALFARETERVATQQKIRVALGDDLFGAWLRGEGADYAASAALAQQQGLAAGVPLELWQAKNDFLLARLQLKARADLTAVQRADTESALASQALIRVTSLIGTAASTDAGRAALSWLPPPRR